MKYFRISYEEVVFKRSYINLILLNRAIPGIEPFDKEDSGKQIHRGRKKSKEQHASEFFMNFM